MDNFNDSLTAAEFKTNNLRETLSQLEDRLPSFVLFSLRWKDLEAYYESLRNVLSQREKEIRALEENVQCRLRYFEERCGEFEVKLSELGILDESMKVLRKEIEVRECEFSERARSSFEAKGREIEEKVEDLESVRREIAERLVEIEERERRVGKAFEERDREIEKKEKELEELRRKDKSRETEIKCRNRELENKERKLEELKEKIEMREKEFECKDRQLGVRHQEYEENVVKLEERLRDVERKERESNLRYNEQFKLLEIRKREVEEKIGNVLLMDEKLKERCGEIESRERKLDERVEEVDLKEKRLAESAEKLKCIERELGDRVKEANLKGQSLDKRSDEFALEKREFEERFKEGIVRERRFLEGIKELEIREEQLQYQKRAIGVAKNQLSIAVHSMLSDGEQCNHGADTAAGVVVQHCVVMDGKALQILLNEHWKEHEKIRDTVSALLRFCSDPAKLVLDALVGFYPPHLKHGDSEFEASIVRDSCLLLLDQLMEVGPNMKPRVKGEALKLSFDWITRMKLDSEHSIEVVAFLELVSAYGLADAFDSNELLDYAENVAHYRQIPKLCRLLGLAGKIPGLIQNLLKRGQHLIALEFIVEFNLSDEFPPASLLDDFMKLSENAAKEIIREGNNSIEAQDQATTKRIAELKDVIKCIKYHDIRPGFSAGSIEQMIDSLKLKASQEKTAAPIGISFQTTELDVKGHNDSPAVVAAVSDSADISASADSPPLTNDATFVTALITASTQQQADVLVEALPNSDVSIPTSVCPLEFQLQTEHTADKGRRSGELQHFDVNVKGLKKLLGEDLAYELFWDDILCVLKSSSDPARLVLDAMRSDPTKLIGLRVKCCIMLLEDVKKLSAVINVQLEAEARRFAKVWIVKLKLKKDDCMEVICFMQFLLVCNLCDVFEEGKVYRLLDPSSWLNKFTEDCQLLGLADFLPNFVERLIANKCLLRAIGYICTFKLDDKFPPEPLLSTYLMNVTKEADAMCDDKNVSPADQIITMKKLKAVRAAIKCIGCYGIGSTDMRKCLQYDLEELEKQKTEIHKLDVGSNDFQQDDVEGLRMLLRGDTCCMSVQDKIARVLKSSLDPAYLVLVMMKNIDPSHLDGDKGFEVGIPKESCILLLEQLRRIFPEIKPQVHDEARQFWRLWRKKLKLTKHDHMGVLCFMLFFKVYNTRSNLFPEDVTGLLNPSGWKQVSESCRKLGLKVVYPDSFIQQMISKKRWLKAIKYIYEFRMDDRFPVVTLLKDYLLHQRSKGDELCLRNNSSPSTQVLAINVKLQAARDVMRCIKRHNLCSLYPLRALEDEIEKLEKQKEGKAHKGDEKSDCRLKRKRKHWDQEDEEAIVGPVGTFKTCMRKKKKRKCKSSKPVVKAPNRSQECPLSYHPMQPPTHPSPHPQPPQQLPTPPPPLLPPPTAWPPPLPLPAPPSSILRPQPSFIPSPQPQPQCLPPHQSPLPLPTPPPAMLPSPPAYPPPLQPPTPPPYPYSFPECHTNGFNWHAVAQECNFPPGQHGWNNPHGYPPVHPNGPMFCEYGPY